MFRLKKTEFLVNLKKVSIFATQFRTDNNNVNNIL